MKDYAAVRTVHVKQAEADNHEIELKYGERVQRFSLTNGGGFTVYIVLGVFLVWGAVPAGIAALTVVAASLVIHLSEML